MTLDSSTEGGAVATVAGTPPREHARSSSHLPAFDGLRGAGCVLVVLLHTWTIVPAEEIDKLGPLRGLFKSGSLGVVMFFVLGSFLVTRGLLDREGDTGRGFDVHSFWVRRIVRVGSQLYLLVIVLYVVSLFDRWDSWSWLQHRRSLTAVSTFTLNISLVNDPAAHREDVGHLWYLSVEQQFYLLWVFVLAWFGRYRVALMASLACGAVAIAVWRLYVFDHQGPWAAELRTTTRADGLLLGALAALLFPYARRFAPAARHLPFPCLCTLAGLVLISSKLDPYAFLKTQGFVFALVSTILVLAIAVADHPGGIAERCLGSRPLVMVGRVSFPLYLWHYPVFWASARWTAHINWAPRAVGCYVVLGGIVIALHKFVERPVSAWLDRTRPPVRQARTA